MILSPSPSSLIQIDTYCVKCGIPMQAIVPRGTELRPRICHLCEMAKQPKEQAEVSA